MRLGALSNRILLVRATLLLVLSLPPTTSAFFLPARTGLKHLLLPRYAAKQDPPDLDDLAPPEFNLSRDSILFGDQPATRKNNPPLRFWRRCKSVLPPYITGAWTKSCGEDNPVGALYNLAFVRLPVITAFGVYLKNSVEGHPFVVDLGNGPFTPNLLIILGLLYLMLGPVLVEKE